MYRQRYEIKPWKKLYSTKRWQSLRSYRLNKEPLCRYCLERGKLNPAEVIDHIRPHKGNEELFYSYENTQSLCKRCHDSAKQSEENKGLRPGCDESGIPMDTKHHWRA